MILQSWTKRTRGSQRDKLNKDGIRNGRQDPSETAVLNNPTSNSGKYSYFTRINNGGMV